MTPKDRLITRISFIFEELQSQIEPDNEEAHYQMDRLQDVVNEFMDYTESVEAKIETVKEVVVHDRKPAA